MFQLYWVYLWLLINLWFTNWCHTLIFCVCVCSATACTCTCTCMCMWLACVWHHTCASVYMRVYVCVCDGNSSCSCLVSQQCYYVIYVCVLANDFKGGVVQTYLTLSCTINCLLRGPCHNLIPRLVYPLATLPPTHISIHSLEPGSFWSMINWDLMGAQAVCVCGTSQPSLLSIILYDLLKKVGHAFSWCYCWRLILYLEHQQSCSLCVM